MSVLHPAERFARLRVGARAPARFVVAPMIPLASPRLRLHRCLQPPWL